MSLVHSILLASFARSAPVDVADIEGSFLHCILLSPEKVSHLCSLFPLRTRLCSEKALQEESHFSERRSRPVWSAASCTFVALWPVRPFLHSKIQASYGASVRSATCLSEWVSGGVFVRLIRVSGPKQFPYPFSIRSRTLHVELCLLASSLPFQDAAAFGDVCKVLDELRVFRDELKAFKNGGLWTAVGAAALYHPSEDVRSVAWTRLEALSAHHKGEGKGGVCEPSVRGGGGGGGGRGMRPLS
jgi:hypothetical protein